MRVHACTDKYFCYAFFEWYHTLKQDYRALNLVKRNSSIRTNPVVLLEYHISVIKLALVGVQLSLTVFLCVCMLLRAGLRSLLAVFGF